MTGGVALGVRVGEDFDEIIINPADGAFIGWRDVVLVDGALPKGTVRQSSATTGVADTIGARGHIRLPVEGTIRRHRVDRLFTRVEHGFALLHIPPCGTISHVTSRPAEAQRLGDLALLRRVRDRIDREYAQPLDVEALARGVNMSAGHLSRQFRLAYGESPYGYLMTRRIERAMALLRRGDLSVTEVCFAVGCQSLGTFSTRFTELVGVPPSVYRRDAARATAGMPPCLAKQVTRPIRNREAPSPSLT